MPRQSVVRIKAEIIIPYDNRKFGAASTAEAHCVGIREALDRALADATLTRWDPEHASIVVDDPAPASDPASQAVITPQNDPVQFTNTADAMPERPTFLDRPKRAQDIT